MSHISIFLELTRLKKPIGFMLLFWPCAWGLSIAYDFQNGIDLVKRLQNQLQQAEQKVEILIKESNGDVLQQPFEN